jgi:hypothetical protein
MNVIELTRFLNTGDLHHRKDIATNHVKPRDTREVMVRSVAECIGDGPGRAPPAISKPSELLLLANRVKELEGKVQQCEQDARLCRIPVRTRGWTRMWGKRGLSRVMPEHPDEFEDLKAELEAYLRMKDSILEALQKKEYEKVMMHQAKSPFKYNFGDKLCSKTGSTTDMTLTHMLSFKRNRQLSLSMPRADVMAYDTIDQFLAHKQEYIKLVVTAYKKEANRLERGLTEPLCSAYIPEEYTSSEQKMSFMKRMMPLLRADLKDARKRQLAIRKEQQDRLNERRKNKLRPRIKTRFEIADPPEDDQMNNGVCRIRQCPGLMNPPMRLWTIFEEIENIGFDEEDVDDSKDNVYLPQMVRKSSSELFSPRPSPRLLGEEHSSGDTAIVKEKELFQHISNTSW